MQFRLVLPGVVGLVSMMVGCQGQVSAGPDLAPAPSPYAKWMNGPPTDPAFFPIMVWAQDTALAPRYKALGVNTYLALWQGPTEQQLAELKAHGMYVICAQNEVGLRHLDDPTIIAWMHGDEPDNHQAEYNGPVPLAKIAGDYAEIITHDPTRPVLVNFGQGVANEDFRGRALPYDRYSLYAHGADIVSYDVYPVANIKYSTVGPDGKRITARRDDGAEYLWYVAKGVDRLRDWTADNKPVWSVLECTAISHPKGHKVTPHQMRAEVWMSLIHGATGLCWFVHDFRPGHRNAAALLEDEVLAKAVGDNNRLVLQLAPVLNSRTLNGAVSVSSSNANVPVDAMVKQHGGATYVFAVAMRNQATRGFFRLQNRHGRAVAEVIGEDRTVDVKGGAFSDDFGPHDVHLYKITAD